MLTHLIYLTFPQWHLGQREQYLPTSHGFDSYLGIPFSQDMVNTGLTQSLSLLNCFLIEMIILK